MLCISSMRDCARCCLLLPFVEPTKMLCQALFKQQHRASSSPPLPHASPLPQSHTEATENSDPLCEQGAASRGESQVTNPDRRGISAQASCFSEDAFVQPRSSMAVFVAQREKGETERRVDRDAREQSGRVWGESGRGC